MGEVAIYCIWDGTGVQATDPAVAKDPAVLTEVLNEGSDPKKREEPVVGPPLHWETPLTCGSKLSRKLGAKVWLKLDNLQPPQSYKIRGVGLLCQRVRVGGRGWGVEGEGKGARMSGCSSVLCLLPVCPSSVTSLCILRCPLFPLSLPCYNFM